MASGSSATGCLLGIPIRLHLNSLPVPVLATRSLAGGCFPG
jgi:hypothetical protein